MKTADSRQQTADGTRVGNLSPRSCVGSRREPTYLPDEQLRYKCLKCEDTGFITFWRENYEFASPCGCKPVFGLDKPPQPTVGEVEAKAGIDLRTEKTLDNFVAETGSQKQAQKIACGYAIDFDLNEGCRFNMLLLGKVGAGKSYLAKAVARSLVYDRHPPIRVTFTLFSQMMRELKNNSNEDSYTSILHRYVNTELLILDDFAKDKARYGTFTEADLKHLFAVIDGRYQKNKPTIITSEATPERLKELDESIYSRLRENAYAEMTFSKSEQNYRLKGVA